MAHELAMFYYKTWQVLRLQGLCPVEGDDNIVYIAQQQRSGTVLLHAIDAWLLSSGFNIAELGCRCDEVLDALVLGHQRHLRVGRNTLRVAKHSEHLGYGFCPLFHVPSATYASSPIC